MRVSIFSGRFHVPGSTFRVSSCPVQGVRGTSNLVFLLIIMLSACDLTGPEADGSSEFVVESYQAAGQPLQPVYLSRTAPIEDSYDFSELAVSGANVRVERLDDEGGVAATHVYREREESPGTYVPESSAVVDPLVEYRLVAEPPGATRPIESRTIVPDTFRIISASADTIFYQASQQLGVRMSRSRYPDRQEVYLFTNEALEPRISRLTPFYAGVGGSDSLGIVQEYRKNSSPLLNAANYGTKDEPSLSVRMPWLMFAFYGSNRIAAQAVDDNLYDFLRSQTVQQGGPTTLGPGEIPSILEHVEGGTGVFGSYARAATTVYLKPPASQ